MARSAAILLWTAATLAAVLVVWAGVRVVAAQVVQPLPAGMPAATSDASTHSPVPTTPGGPVEPSPGAPASPGEPTATATPSPQPTSTPDEPPHVSPTPSPTSGTTSETRHYDLVGGTVTLRFSSGRIEVLAAAPKSGFRLEPVESDGREVRVEFRSDGHRSRLDADWEESEPRVRIRET